MTNDRSSASTARPVTRTAPAIAGESKTLLPAGLQDILPPDAGRAADVTNALLAGFARWGYRRVRPPLIEFEDSLLTGAGARMASETFRLMDPVSQRMMGLRADMTLQIARIAVTRLTAQPRPLRLAYAGDVLRVRGTQLRPDRQFTQIGAELIGVENAAADAEAILMAVEGLRTAGMSRLSVDLSLPRLVPGILATLDLAADKQAAIRAALDKKDLSAVTGLAGDGATLLAALMQATGMAEDALPRLQQISLPAAGGAEITRLADVIARVRQAAPDLPLTIDPVENRGFEYHHGVSFTIFAAGIRGEMGHGGRYLAGEDHEGTKPEPATGFTLYLDSILRAIPAAPTGQSLYLPATTTPDKAAALRADGWVTLAGLNAEDISPANEARRLGCTHFLSGDDILPLS